MKLPSGSTLWLLAHELRLDWRRRTDVSGARRWTALALTLGAPLFLGVAVGVPAGLALTQFGPPTSRQASLIAAATLASAFIFMLSQALSEVVDSLYERGDLDLLFSSPIPPRRVITVRAMGVAFAAFTVFGFFSCGPLVAMALMGHPLWLATLPVLYACALAATGVALALSAGLIRLVGAKRTRIVGQALSVAFGSLIFLGMQVFTLAGGQVAGGFMAERLARASASWAPAWTGYALRAFEGQPLAFCVVVGVLLLCFGASVGLFGPAFAALHAVAQGAQFGRAARTAPVRGFRKGVYAAVLVKEMRLLLCDPMLLPLIVLRLIYLLPAGVLAVRYGAQLNFTALSGAVLALTLMANQMAGSLAWMTISAEDAPDLLACSPAPAKLLLRVKLAAAVGSVLAMVALAAIPLAFVSPYQGAVAFAGCASAAVSAGLLNLWWQRPGKRTAFRKRASAPWFVTLAELALGLLIALATGLFSAHQASGLAPALAAVLVLAALRLPVKP